MTDHDYDAILTGDQNTDYASTHKALLRSITTLGERLTYEARRIVWRRAVNFSWLAGFEALLTQITALPVPDQSRFQRVEAEAAHWPQQHTQTEWMPPHTHTHNRTVQTPPTALQWSTSADQQLGQALDHEESISQSASTPSSPKPTPTQNDAQGQPLAPHLQQNLRAIVGKGVETVRVHNDDSANALAQHHRAKAVTVGRDVFFRQGYFQPDEDDGFALLTHEVVHVLQAMRPTVGWLRATQAGLRQEENEATQQQQAGLHARRNLGSSLSPQPAIRQTPQTQLATISSEQQRPFATQSSTTFGKQRQAKPTSAASGPGILPAAAVFTSPTTTTLRPMLATMDDNPVSETPPSPSTVASGGKDTLRALLRGLRTDIERGG